jgi:hypothetical protein
VCAKEDKEEGENDVEVGMSSINININTVVDPVTTML